MASNKYYNEVFDAAVEDATKKGARGIVFRNFDFPGKLMRSPNYQDYVDMVNLIKAGIYTDECAVFSVDTSVYLVTALKENMDLEKEVFLREAEKIASAKGKIEYVSLMPIIY